MRLREHSMTGGLSLEQVHHGVKAACESALVRGRVPAVYRSLVRRRAVILAYHNVVRDGAIGAGDPSLHLPLSAFRAQLDHLAANYDVVPLDAVLDRAPGTGGRPVAAITFDDAYRGAVELAVPELHARHLPATIFVSPAFVGGASFWWDAIGRGRPGDLSPEERHYALDELRGADDEIRRWASTEGMRLGAVDPMALCTDYDSLAAASERRGITIAPHGWSHRNLSRLNRAELRDELFRPLQWLRERFHSVIPWLAYPYGEFDDGVARACAREGYVAALANGNGWVPGLIPNRYAIPRVSVPAGISLEGFILRTSGLVAG